MGGSSSSKKQTSYTTNNQYLSDQSYRDNSRDYEDSFNTYTDHGAVSGALDLAGDSVNKVLESNGDTVEMSLDFSGDTVNSAFTFGSQALGQVQRAQESALSFANNISKTATAPDSETLKYALIGAGLLGAAMVVRK